MALSSAAWPLSSTDWRMASQGVALRRGRSRQQRRLASSSSALSRAQPRPTARVLADTGARLKRAVPRRRGTRFSTATTCRLSRPNRGSNSRFSTAPTRPLGRALGVTRNGWVRPSSVHSTAQARGSSTTQRYSSGIRAVRLWALNQRASSSWASTSGRAIVSSPAPLTRSGATPSTPRLRGISTSTSWGSTFSQCRMPSRKASRCRGFSPGIRSGLAPVRRVCRVPLAQRQRWRARAARVSGARPALSFSGRNSRRQPAAVSRMPVARSSEGVPVSKPPTASSAWRRTTNEVPAHTTAPSRWRTGSIQR